MISNHNEKPDSKVPEISVVVPACNHSRYIQSTLQSIFRQTLKPTKLLVIDDGSSDDTAKVAEQTLKDCPFDCELIVRENRGLSATLNEGLKKTAGDLFAYIGSDDIWLDEFLERQACALADNPTAVLAYGHCFIMDEKGQIFDSTANHKDSKKIYESGDGLKLLLNGFAPVSCTVLYRRAPLEKVGWNEAARLEDFETYLRILKYGGFAFEARELSIWRQHRNNTSRNVKMMLEEILGALERNAQELEITPKELENAKAVAKFRYARIALQYGNKRLALELARQSWHKNKDINLIKFMCRMAVPMAAVSAYRNIKRKSSVYSQSD
jgi:alpha-1,3-rhamnosyltransferase